MQHVWVNLFNTGSEGDDIICCDTCQSWFERHCAKLDSDALWNHYQQEDVHFDCPFVSSKVSSNLELFQVSLIDLACSLCIIKGTSIPMGYKLKFPLYSCWKFILFSYM
jgi:hypothetical protein